MTTNPTYRRGHTPSRIFLINSSPHFTPHLATCRGTGEQERHNLSRAKNLFNRPSRSKSACECSIAVRILSIYGSFFTLFFFSTRAECTIPNSSYSRMARKRWIGPGEHSFSSPPQPRRPFRHSCLGNPRQLTAQLSGGIACLDARSNHSSELCRRLPANEGGLHVLCSGWIHQQ